MRRRTILLILLAFILFIVTAGIIVGSFLMHSYFGIWPWDAFGMKTFSEEELQEKALTFTRNYPEVIKGNWEPSDMHMAKMLRDDPDRLKELGVNTVSVSVEYEFNADGSYNTRGDERLIANIVRAKEKGFAVLVTPNFVGPSGHNFEEEGIPITLEEYLKISEEVALKWAEISEKYKVEFFAPQNEFDFMIRNNFADTGPEVAEITSNWHKQMLPKIEQVYTGKKMAKLANIEEEIDVTGYDYVGITISHGNEPVERTGMHISQQYSTLSRVAEISGAQWLVSEAWFPYGGPFYPEAKNEDGESLDELQDDYFKVSIGEYLKITENKPSGYIFIAWIMPGMDIKDRPAEAVLKEFYSEI